MMDQDYHNYEAKYKMLFELAVDAFFHSDENGNLIMVNNKAVELTGYPKEELTTMNLRHFFSESVLLQSPLQPAQPGLGEVINIEKDILRKDGRIVRVEMHSKQMPDGTYQSFFRDVTKRAQTEQALADSEKRYRKLHQNMIDGFVLANMQGFIIDSNKAYRELVGYSIEELGKITYKDLTPEKWHSIEHEIVKNQILTEGHSAVYEKEYIHKNGTIFPVELRTILAFDEQGEKEGMWAIVRDISLRKRAEEQLRESEEKYRSIIESSLTAMLFYTLNEDQQLIFQGGNPAADTILGISHNSMIGQTIVQAFPNLANTPVPEMYIKVALGITGPQSFEIAYSDERFSGYYMVHVFKTGNKAITVDFIDISKRRQTEDALQRSEIEYRDTLHSLPDWIYVTDNKFRFAVINASLSNAMKEYGIGPKKTGTEISAELPFFASDDIDAINVVFQTGKISNHERRIMLHNREMFAEITMIPILKAHEVVKVIVIIRDRSKEKEIEELKQRSADQKEVMLREIHHRVKNNLAIVISLLTFQLNENTNPEIKRSLIDIQTRIRAMALIHEHLYRSENLDKIPLATYILSLMQMIMSAYSGHRVQLESNLEPIDVTIETALPVGLIINELLTNAFKYAFPGNDNGMVIISLAKAEDDYCVLSVKDNGIGLPQSFIPESSVSIGLYIVRLLAEQMDGSIQIEREKGTTFSIRFRNLFKKPR